MSCGPFCIWRQTTESSLCKSTPPFLNEEKDDRTNSRVELETDIRTSWEPFPGSGTVMRIPVGWPSRATSTIYPPANTADECTINQLDSLMGDAEFREKLYQHTLEMWDLDIEYFRIWLMSTDGDDMWDVDPQDFEDVVVQSVAQGSSYFT